MNHAPARFHDRVAVVTGAASGIGAAGASRLAAEGAAVILADIDTAHGEAVAAGIRDKGAAPTSYGRTSPSRPTGTASWPPPTVTDPWASSSATPTPWMSPPRTR